MSTGIRFFTPVCKPINYYSIQKASFSYLITNKFNSKTFLHKPVHFNNYLKNTMMSGAGGGKNFPKLPSNNNASTSAPVIPPSNTDSLPKTKEEFDKVKPFSFSPSPKHDIKTPSAPSIPLLPPVPSLIKKDQDAAQKALKSIEDHQKFTQQHAVSRSSINNQTPDVQNTNLYTSSTEIEPSIPSVKNTPSTSTVTKNNIPPKSGLVVGAETNISSPNQMMISNVLSCLSTTKSSTPSESVSPDISVKNKMNNVLAELKTAGKVLYSENDNMKPQQVLQLINNANKPFQTTITSITKAEDLTEQDLINEAKKRLLVKPDDGKTSSFIKLENGTVDEVGACKNFIKTSPLGQAYHKRQLDTRPELKHSFNDNFKKDDYDFFVATPPVSENCIIETGLNKHLLIVQKKDTEEYFAIAYLTSKHSGEFLCDTQFKVFQQKLENNTEIVSHKEQRFVGLNIAIKIQAEDIKKTLGGEEYLKVNINENSREMLKDLWDKLKETDYIDYNKNGISKEVLLEMIKDHDQTVVNKGKHPLTADQIKLIEKEKIKMKTEKEKKVKEQSPHVEKF